MDPKIEPVVEENPPPITVPEYKYEDINNKTPAEIAREEPPKVEEKVVEPVIDQEAVNRQIAEDTARAVLEQQKADALAEESSKVEEVKPQTEKERVYEEWANKFNSENSRQPTYLEAMEFVEEQAVANIEARQQERYRVEQERQQTLERTREEETQKVNSYVDDELNDLYKSGRLTRIADNDNPSDQGVVERKSLFETWAKVNTERRAQGLPDIISATRIAEFYWEKPSNQPAGANAPVQGSRSSSVGEESQEYSNADLKRPWSFFKKN